ncbi:MAG: hypothetical protein ABR535_07110, partial [Pyrinomonadaceae bacterium]
MYLAVLAAAVIVSGCVANDQGSLQQPQPPPSQPASTNTNVSAQAPEAPAVPITLPMVEAILADESFINEAKSGAALTDEDFQKLRDAARNEVLT